MSSSHFRFLMLLIATVIFSSISQAQTVPPAWNSSTSYKIGDLVTYGLDTFRCEQNQTTSHPNPHLPGWELDFVHSPTFTIPVGPTVTFKTLGSAWAYIASAKISNGSSLVIQLQTNYKETFTTNVVLDHPYGSKISIIGTNKGQVATFSNQSTGFVLDKGCVLADLEGLTIVGPASGSNATPGILVNQNACLAQLKNVEIERFDYGIQANASGTIDKVSQIAFSGFTGGVWATKNGVINISSPVTIDGGGSGTFAFQADTGTISCQNCVGRGCKTAFSALNGGKLDATGATANVATAASIHSDGVVVNYAFSASAHGVILAKGATSTNYTFAFAASGGGYIDAQNTTGSGSAGYVADSGGIIMATGHNGGTENQVTTTGGYVVGF